MKLIPLRWRRRYKRIEEEAGLDIENRTTIFIAAERGHTFFVPSSLSVAFLSLLDDGGDDDADIVAVAPANDLAT
jgi:hypothetical protein